MLAARLPPSALRLETDIATLEQHLENMRATYQLNTEKLEYNYRVLVERDHENQATVTQQKRKISRQRDILVNLKQKYNDTDRKYQDDNAKLTDEYRRITEQFKDLQARGRGEAGGPLGECTFARMLGHCLATVCRRQTICTNHMCTDYMLLLCFLCWLWLGYA